MLSPADSEPLLTVSVLTQHADDTDWLGRAIGSIDDPRAIAQVRRSSSTHVGHARRIHLRNAAAPFCTYLDPDDYLAPGALAAGLDFILAHPDAPAVFCPAHTLTADGEFLPPAHPPPPIADRDTILTNPRAVTKLLIWRTPALLPFLQELEDFPLLEDWWIAARLFTLGPLRRYEGPPYIRRHRHLSTSSRVTPAHKADMYRRITNLLEMPSYA